MGERPKTQIPWRSRAASSRRRPGCARARWSTSATIYEAYGFSTQGFDVYLATDLEQGTRATSAEEQDMLVERVKVPQFEELARRGEIKDAPSVAAYGLLRLRMALG